MTDIITDIRINGKTVAQSDIRFLDTPLSGPAGSIPVTKVAKSLRFDMMNAPFRDTSLWPATRPRKSHEQQSKRRWLHGDYKDAPYLLTHGLYRKIVEIEK